MADKLIGLSVLYLIIAFGVFILTIPAYGNGGKEYEKSKLESFTFAVFWLVFFLLAILRAFRWLGMMTRKAVRLLPDMIATRGLKGNGK